MGDDESIKNLIDSIGILNFISADDEKHTITFKVFDLDDVVHRKWEVVYGSQKKNDYKLFLIWNREEDKMYFKTDLNDKEYPLKKIGNYKALEGKAMIQTVDYLTYKLNEKVSQVKNE